MAAALQLARATVVLAFAVAAGLVLVEFVTPCDAASFCTVIH